SWWVALTSFVALAFATRVLFRAVYVVHALAWERSAASVRLKGRPFAIFASAVLGQITIGAGVGAIHHRTALGGLLTLVVYAFAAGAIWLVVSLQVPHANAGWRGLVPGSLLYGVGSTGVAVFNVLILGWMIASKAST